MLDEKLNAAVDEFVAEMKSRLLEKQKVGYNGWDDPAHNEGIRRNATRDAAIPGQEVDAANRLMMLWYQAGR